MNRLDRFFEITHRGSTVGAEIRGGLVTFIAMAYIVVLNPIILSGPKDIAGNHLQFAAVSAVTALTRLAATPVPLKIRPDAGKEPTVSALRKITARSVRGAESGAARH